MTAKNDHSDKKVGSFWQALLFIFCGLSLTFPGNLEATLASHVKSIEYAVDWSEVIEWKSHSTAVISTSFKASGYNEGVLIEWKTGYEVNNLGFHLYREEGGQLVQINPELIKGSALMTGAETRTAGYSYTRLHIFRNHIQVNMAWYNLIGGIYHAD